jgi:hypothetical protein
MVLWMAAGLIGEEISTLREGKVRHESTIFCNFEVSLRLLRRRHTPSVTKTDAD